MKYNFRVKYGLIACLKGLSIKLTESGTYAI